MARGVTITPNGGTGTELVPRPGTLSLGHENMDVGGDGVPNCRNSAPMKLDFEVVVDASAPSHTTILGLKSKTYSEADSSAAVAFHSAVNANTYTISDASVKVSLEGEGVMIAKISVKGNGVKDD